MTWGGGVGTGDLIAASGDNITTGVFTGQTLFVGSAQITHVMSDMGMGSASNLLRGLIQSDVVSARGVIGMLEAITAPGSGDGGVSAGWLFVQSGGLHYLGTLGTLTVVGSP